MKYVSKKDPNIVAAFDFEDTKCATTRLIYLTGEKAGKSFVVSNSTLKRYWKQVETEEVVEPQPNPLNIDFEQVSKPYKPDVKPRYIPKPQSVIEYEERKHIRSRASFDFPHDYEEFADLLSKTNVVIKKVNTGYISLHDNSKIKLQKNIAILASQELGEKFVAKGFQSKPCIEKGTPFRLDICNEEEYKLMWEIFNE